MEQLLKETLKPNSNCVDVGAHEGWFLKRFLSLAPEGQHFAIEPLPHLSEKLVTDFPRVHVFSCALSNETGRASFFYVPEMPGWSGLGLQPYPMETHPQTIEVDVRRLDDLIPETRIDFVKIDVEGAEELVLEGCVKTIDRFHPVILFEHARIHNLNYPTTPERIFQFFSACGMSIYSLDGSYLTEDELRDIYDSSYASNYDRLAQTNFVARM
jgi:FkbM family methyltransferase